MIENLARADNYPFFLPQRIEVSATDAYGYSMPQIAALNGQAYEVVEGNAGESVLQLSNTSASSPDEVAIYNNLVVSTINVDCYKGGKLIAQKTILVPGQKAVFKFLPKIWLGFASNIVEGAEINSASLSGNTEIDLTGISSADIVLTGGDTGPNSNAFEFHLENIQR